MTTTGRRWTRICATALLVAGAASACGIGEQQALPSPSPDLAPPPPLQEGLPRAVSDTRGRIYVAASEGDFEALRSLIDPTKFTYSFGDGGDAIAYWRNLEAEGEDPLGTMVEVLEQPYAVQRGIYAWPEAFVTTDYYFDYRIGIERDGDWVFFVAGD